MTLYRALHLAVMACEHIYALGDAPDITEWCAAAQLIRSLLDDARGPVDDWFMSAPGRKRRHRKPGGGKLKSEYER